MMLTPPNQKLSSELALGSSYDKIKSKENPNLENTPNSTSSRTSVQGSSNIKVICRFRPINEKEVKSDLIPLNLTSQSKVIVGSGQEFRFDQVFDGKASQNDIYQYSVLQTVDDFFKGYNGTILAYGQTGSGKSYTMMGDSISDSDNKGIIPRISEELFQKIIQGSTDVEFMVGVSYMEIYMEQIRDLLQARENQKFSIHEDKSNGIFVKGLSQAFVSSSKDLFQVLNQGIKHRTGGSTNMNQESSRSHAILQIKLSQKVISTGAIKKSNLFLVDLAGSEKFDKTGAHGQTFEEAKKINSSLSALGNVINALTDGKSTHIPYRDSKLTRILQESLGGNSRTSLIINCSPSSMNEAETLSTLRFGSRAKRIKNNAHINTELSIEELRTKVTALEKIKEQHEIQISHLEKELLHWKRGPDSQKRVISSPVSNVFDNGSRLPISEEIMSVSKIQNDDIERRDLKIEELENIILDMRMENLKASHQEESKLFQLENTLHRLSDKLSDVELVNNNLRRHLLISEKIIESRDLKISKLSLHLKEQKMLISNESINFENKLEYIRGKLETYSQNSESVVEEIKVSPNSLKKNSDLRSSPRLNSESHKNSPNYDTSSGSPKMGLNLRIVKPLRGGGGSHIHDILDQAS